MELRRELAGDLQVRHKKLQSCGEHLRMSCEVRHKSLRGCGEHVREGAWRSCEVAKSTYGRKLGGVVKLRRVLARRSLVEL